MKIIILAYILLACISCGCPFSSGKNKNYPKPEYLKSDKIICEDTQVVINGKCQINDLSMVHNSQQSVRFNEDSLIRWYYPDDKSINIMIQLEVRSWVGLSFKNGMEHGDMAIFEIGSYGVVYGWTAFSRGQQTPKPYPNQNMMKLLGYKITKNKEYPFNKSIVIKFNRLVDVGINQWAKLTPNSPQMFAIAYNKPGKAHLQYHSVDQKKHVNLYDIEKVEEQKLQQDNLSEFIQGYINKFLE